MRNLSFVLLAFTLMIVGSLHAEALHWLTSYPEAIAAAQEQKKPILVNFTGSDWCIWCMKLDKEIFDKPEFAAWAKDSVILLKLDFPRSLPQPDAVKQANADLADKYKVEGFPTILILDSNGHEHARTGYKHLTPAAYIHHLEDLLQ